MDEATLERAKQHIEAARAGRGTVRIDGALERARLQLETLTEVASSLETSLPEQIQTALTTGLRDEVASVARNLAEIRGLLNNTLRRLGHLEEELLAERSARIEDLALLVELVSAGWRSVDARLALLEPRASDVRTLTSERAA
jgi:chromosome segregation ATPase